MNHAVFLDRDGVINDAVLRDGKPYPPATLDELVISPDVPGALGLLKSLGFRLIVVTNQPDVARGRQSRQAVEAINSALMARLPLDHMEVCFHDDADDCACRKPKPGLLIAGAQALNVDLRGSYMIGDRWKDITAGKAAGCCSVWIDRSYRETTPDDFDHRAVSLRDAANWINERFMDRGRQ